MKAVNSKVRLVLLALLCCCGGGTTATGAQEETGAPSTWIKVAPEGAAFTVLMPAVPDALEEGRKSTGGLEAAGRRYRVKDGEAVYTIWSLQTRVVPAGVQSDAEVYLDLCAELAWDLLVKPDWERAKKSVGIKPGNAFGMSYQRALPSPSHPGRNYLLGVGRQRGATQIYLKGSQLYIVAALGETHPASNPEVFMKSFSLPSPRQDEPKAPSAGVETARAGSHEDGAARAADTQAQAATDYSKPFSTKELTQRARITSKPEPLYTESARKFGVTGTVRVRVLLSASGKVSAITVVTRLPHGLTQKAVEAAQKISFDPAVKDGRLVSQYVTIDYNFNIY
jgi:TonB family protein